MSNFTLEKITNLCKRRGLIFQSSEIYGGINGFWDYGPQGVSMKRAIEQLWWDYMVEKRHNIEGQDSTIICHPQVWDASGHTAQFSDYMVDNKITKKRYRLDNLIDLQSKSVIAKLAEICKSKPDAEILEADIVNKGKSAPKLMSQVGMIDPSNKKLGDWTEPRQFNLMMQTYVGSVFDEDHKAYLRAETCQSIFTNYQTIQNVSRQKLPFGIAQIGKAFRNEINPRNFIFRSREFTQMEMEFFCHDDEGINWYDYWKNERLKFYTDILKLDKKTIRTHKHPENKLAHYAKAALDIEFKFPFGWGELEGIHHRGTWDISRHAEYSKTKMDYYDQENNRWYTPTIIETSVGVDRLILAILCHFYDEDEAVTQKKDKETDVRIVMRIPAIIAPRQVAILPLSKKLGKGARKIYDKLARYFRVDFDDRGAIGRRYRRQDEIGTPFCITFDFETEEKQQITVRHRDTMKQEIIEIDNLISYLDEKING